MHLYQSLLLGKRTPYLFQLLSVLRFLDTGFGYRFKQIPDVSSGRPDLSDLRYHLPVRRSHLPLEKEVIGVHIQRPESVLFRTDYLQADYHRQDHDSDLPDTGALHLSLPGRAGADRMGFRLSGSARPV